MRFQPNDVARVVVHRDFVERAKRELPKFAERIFEAPPSQLQIN